MIMHSCKEKNNTCADYNHNADRAHYFSFKTNHKCPWSLEICTGTYILGFESCDSLDICIFHSMLIFSVAAFSFPCPFRVCAALHINKVKCRNQNQNKKSMYLANLIQTQNCIFTESDKHACTSSTQNVSYQKEMLMIRYLATNISGSSAIHFSLSIMIIPLNYIHV